ncbi:MAG: hypothetical protein WA776_20405 [Xanthobacteraceae bacterium]
MCNLQKAFLGAVFVASMLVGTSPGAYAQYQTWNGCPPGWTVQGGACRPYQGPVGGPPPGYGYQPHGYQPYGYQPYGYYRPRPRGYSCTYAGCCPRGFSVQDGVCKPYRGY